jgi:hypothetical protein
MRSKIHKLKPEDLEEPIIEKSITHSGTNGHMKPHLEIKEEYQLLYA